MSMEDLTNSLMEFAEKKEQLEIKLGEAHEDIEMLNLTLVALTSAGPHEVFGDDGTRYEWVDYVSMKTAEISEDLRVAYVNQWMYSNALNQINKTDT